MHQTQAAGSMRGQIIGAGCAIGAASQHEPKVAQVRDVSEVERELNRLGAATNHLHELIDMLGMRLTPVTSPVPIGAGDNSAEPRAGSPVGSAIQDQRSSVEEAARRVQSIIASLAI